MNLLKEFGLNDIKSVFRQTDKVLLLLSIALSVFGGLMVCTATFDGENYISRDTAVMFIALAIGVAASLVISLIDYEIIYKLWWFIAGICLFLMLLLIPFGVAPDGRSDARSWLNLGVVFLQPSEILKIGFIVTFSLHLSKV